MSHVFLLTMPRAGGAALARMMGADEECISPVLEALHGRPDAARLLPPGVYRAIHFGGGEWKKAVERLSWLLRAFPGCRVVFLTRPEDPSGAYEMSIFATVAKWVPAYGKCFGRVLTQTRTHRRSFEDFHLMNPSRTVLLDHADLEDFDAVASKLGEMAPPRALWEKVATERPNARKGPAPKKPPLPEELKGWELIDYDADPFEKLDEAAEQDWRKIDFDENPFAALEAAPEVLARYRAKRPRPFLRFPAQHPRAIVYPWLSTGAKWEEIYYSLRSIEANFADKECPIYIMGDAPPPRLKPGGRVRWLGLQAYASTRQNGMWHAHLTGLQLADEVCWMNDDICFLRETGWDDLREALTEGRLDGQVGKLLTARNIWKRGLGQAVADMMKLRPGTPVWRFATHTPFLFEREKSLEVLSRFHLPYKGSWVTTYHNYHQTPHRPCGGLKVNRLPAPKAARYLNYNDHTLTQALKERLAALFPHPAEWERS